MKPVERKATAMGGSSYPWFPPLWRGAFFLLGAVLTRTLGLSGDYSAFWVERVA